MGDEKVGPIRRALAEDHRRIEALCERGLESDETWIAFRSALLRHIGIEEKIVMPALRAHGIDPDPVKQIRLDHSAFAGLVTPPPSADRIQALLGLLEVHDPLEEGPDGMYTLADERLPEAELADVLARIASAPEPPLAAPYRGERAFPAIERLLEAAYAPRRAALEAAADPRLTPPRAR